MFAFLCVQVLTFVPFLSGDEKDSLITFAGFGKKTGSGATAAVSATCFAGLVLILVALLCLSD